MRRIEGTAFYIVISTRPSKLVTGYFCRIYDKPWLENVVKCVIIRGPFFWKITFFWRLFRATLFLHQRWSSNSYNFLDRRIRHCSRVIVSWLDVRFLISKYFFVFCPFSRWFWNSNHWYTDRGIHITKVHYRDRTFCSLFLAQKWYPCGPYFWSKIKSLVLIRVVLIRCADFIFVVVVDPPYIFSRSLHPQPPTP